MKQIIVCDDDEGILEVIKLVLEEKGYEVTTISDTEKIYSTIERMNPDLILLDLWMPVLSGESITRELKKRGSTKNIPVIIISAKHEMGKIAKQAGADDFLSKPFDIEDLETIVERYA